jgi:adenosine deaminase
MTWKRAGAGTPLMLAAALLWGSTQAVAQQVSSAEELTARHFDAVRADPVRTLMFLRELPKGGDLHTHLSGAVYAETYIRWAAEEGLCIAEDTGGIVPPPCAAASGRPPAEQALRSSGLHDTVVDALSIRNWHPARRTGHAQFFGSFDLFRMVSVRTGDMVAEVASRAALGRVSYLELMATIGGLAPMTLGAHVGWAGAADATRSRLLQAGMLDTVARARQSLDAAERRAREILRCGTTAADAGCDVVVRYQYQVARAREPAQVFAQLLAGFELTRTDPRIVGVNMVQPEDHVVAMRDYELHMEMIEALHRHYPDVPVALHAGELRSGLVPPEGLRFHIRSAVERARARRIGHGVSIAHERDADGLLREMARRGVLVEIALNSNDVILGVRGADHPLRLYMSYGVPVALATDDEGVLRSEMTMEYLKAVQEHGLGYLELKQLARNSLEYAFVEGASLWADINTARRVPPCSEREGLAASACAQFLERSVRAQLQARLETAFAELEQRYAGEAAWTGR